MDNRSSDEISNHIVEMEHELQGMIENKQIVSENYGVIQKSILILKKDIAEKEIEKRELLDALNKSKHNIRIKEIELDIERKKFWSVRKENR